MKTIAIVSQKGRAGETTLVLHLACAAQAGGVQSAIVDLDSQASAAAWHDSGEAEAPVVAALPYTRLAQGLQAARMGGVPSSPSIPLPTPRRQQAPPPESLTYGQSGQPPSWSISPRSRPGSSSMHITRAPTNSLRMRVVP